MAELNDEKLEQVAKALVWSAWFAQSQTAPSQCDIQLGDMVFEFTTIHEPPYLDKVGILIGYKAIETLDGRIVRWENADFKKIPQGRDFETRDGEISLLQGRLADLPCQIDSFGIRLDIAELEERRDRALARLKIESPSYRYSIAKGAVNSFIEILIGLD